MAPSIQSWPATKRVSKSRIRGFFSRLLAFCTRTRPLLLRLAGGVPGGGVGKPESDGSQVDQLQVVLEALPFADAQVAPGHNRPHQSCQRSHARHELQVEVVCWRLVCSGNTKKWGTMITKRRDIGDCSSLSYRATLPHLDIAALFFTVISCSTQMIGLP